MGRPDSILGQFRETARCRDAQHGDGVCCTFAPQLVLSMKFHARNCHLPLKCRAYKSEEYTYLHTCHTLKNYANGFTDDKQHFKFNRICSEYLSFSCIYVKSVPDSELFSQDEFATLLCLLSFIALMWVRQQEGHPKCKLSCHNISEKISSRDPA